MTEAAFAGESFADPPVDTARSFRLILDALAQPGKVVPYTVDLQPPRGLTRPLAGALLTLCDPDTTVWLAESMRSATIVDWIRFHTGARLTGDPAAAMFVAGQPVELSAVGEMLAIGTLEYPDRSATLLVSAGPFESGGTIILTGPGNAVPRALRVAAVASPFWMLLQRNSDLFPLGIDCILASADAVAAIPRSSTIQIAGDA